MMHKKGIPVYMVRLFVSRLEKYVLTALYLLLGGITLCLPLLWCLPVLLSLLSGIFYYWRKPQKYTQLMTQANGDLLLEKSDGQIISVQVQKQTVVYPFLIILWVRHTYTERVLLWADSADQNDVRLLRIWLIWHWSAQDRSAKQDKRSFG